MVFSCRTGARLVSVVPFDLGGREVVEFAMDALVVKPRHPLCGLYLEVVQALPVASDAGEHGRVAKQFGLEECEHRLSHRIIKRIADSSDRGRDTQLLETLGVGKGDVLTRFNRRKQHLLVGLIVGARRRPPLVSSIRGSFEVSC